MLVDQNVFGQNSPTASRSLMPVEAARSFPPSTKISQEIGAIPRQVWYVDARQRALVKRLLAHLDRIGQHLLEQQKAAAAPAVELIPAPRPNSGTVWIHIDNTPPGEYLLKVLNSSNQIVYIEVLRLNGLPFSKTLQLTHLPSGVYPIVVSSSDGLVSKPKQLVVER